MKACSISLPSNGHDGMVGIGVLQQSTVGKRKGQESNPDMTIAPGLHYTPHKHLAQILLTE